MKQKNKNRKGSETYTNEIDNGVDVELFNCLDLEKPKSFFLFAGAGSGKTRSLINVLAKIQETYGHRLRMNRQQVAIITYTNAACEEIQHRLKHDALFAVSTIHSFIWELIRPYTNDVREWLRNNLTFEIADLNDQQSRARGPNKSSIDREKKIESKTKRLKNIDGIKRFTYNPNGDAQGRDSLNHAEVIKLGAYFLEHKPLMQTILLRKFPILLIDESQDTKKELIDAFFKVQANNPDQFSLGLFGDTMQRIYSDGKENLGKDLPKDWQTPAKKMNHRCPKRVISLINKIRESTDKQQQLPRTDKDDGTVRFFIVPNTNPSKQATEDLACERMAEITGDKAWIGPDSQIKILTLEHHMAAKRMGFTELFDALYRVDRLKTSLLDGTLPAMRFFTQLILPLIKAKQKGDEFAVAKIVRENSPLFEKKFFKQNKSQQEIIKKANESVNSLFDLWKNGNNPKLLDVLLSVSKSGLFSIPNQLSTITSRTEAEQQVVADAMNGENEEEDNDNVTDAWDIALAQPFTQMEAYDQYVSDNSRFGTHQGVKGLEFPRVMVIIDDNEAGGFLFSYEKLFGAKPPSDTDIKNEKAGKDSSYDRTLRLFYVACSRAEQSLAIVAYTADPTVIAKTVTDNGWFSKEEVEMLNT